MADLLIRNAHIWTGDPHQPLASTAFVRGRIFAFVGDEADVSAPVGTSTLDLGGRFMMPGLGDAHVHLLGTGFAMQSVDLKAVPTVEEAVRRVAERIPSTPADGWVTGAGWDQNAWTAGRFPTRQQLDAAAPDHPVVLTHTSGHCTWANTVALRLAGVTADTQPPVGGAIDVDEAGEPTGILRDKASDLVTSAMPHPSQTDRIRAVEAAVAHAQSLGLTMVHAMNVGRGEFQALHALNDSGKLKLRVRMYLSHDRLDEWIGRGITTGDGDDKLRVGGVKFFSDGALGSLTAWTFEPYASAPGSGFPLQPVEDLERDVRRCLQAGLATAVHAIGDRANREALDIYERARDLAPGLVRRIEHAQLLTEQDISRFARLGVVASMQPIHATADWRKVDREWGDRGRWAYAFASLERAGTTLAFGSDSPVETIDPLAGVHAAVTRQTVHRKPEGGWYPDELISTADAMHHYTSGVAGAVREADANGRIATGARADFVVLSGDPLALKDPMQLLELQSDVTATGGEVVYVRQDRVET